MALRKPGEYTSLNVRFDDDADDGRELMRKVKMYASRDGHRIKDFVVRALRAEIEKAEKRK